MSLILSSFYKFVKLTDLEVLQKSLGELCRQKGLKGTILLASEGINGTIAGSQTAIASAIDYLHRDSRFSDLEVKTCPITTLPFKRMKVKIKQEIVSFDGSKVNPCEGVGTYVSPREWNQLICDPQVTLIDTRNEYEVKIGTFKGAQNPHIDSFREFPTYIDRKLDPTRQRKVALFCTGGIRCEKVTAKMLAQGFQEVYHLKGGILKYLQEIPPQESLWEGECFVFDERVALRHGLEIGSYQLCPHCGDPIPKNTPALASHVCPQLSKIEPRIETIGTTPDCK